MGKGLQKTIKTKIHENHFKGLRTKFIHGYSNLCHQNWRNTRLQPTSIELGWVLIERQNTVTQAQENINQRQNAHKKKKKKTIGKLEKHWAVKTN